MKTLVIIDTQNGHVSPLYRELLPGVEISGLEPESVHGVQCHPHGAQCGWLAGVPLALAAGEKWELFFCRMFDEHARMIPGWEDFVLSVVEEVRPAVVSRSWGGWDGDSDLGRMIARLAFDKFTPRYEELQREIGFVDFAAAGNNDANDRDADVAYPQAYMADTHIVGAVGRDGVPAEWSGDGPGLECTFWGDMTGAPGAGGEMQYVSGTSFAAPKAAGLCAMYGCDSAGWTALCEAYADRPLGSWELPHPKWGFGCMEKFWQQALVDYNNLREGE